MQAPSLSAHVGQKTAASRNRPDLYPTFFGTSACGRRIGYPTVNNPRPGPCRPQSGAIFISAFVGAAILRNFASFGGIANPDRFRQGAAVMLRAAALITLIGTSSVWTAADANPLLSQVGPVPTVAAPEQAVMASVRPKQRRLAVPDARWDTKPGRKSWTLAVLKGLRSHAHALPDIVPRDIASYCPAYPTASREQREAFWVGLISSLAWHESTHRPTAVGGGGRWYGLTQILPDTARRYQCKAKSGSALKDPEDNLSCALRIMAVTVKRDKVVSAGMRGVAADWGPFHSSRKRSDIMDWTRSQSYCQGIARSLRPVARPDELQQQWETERMRTILASFENVRPEARPISVFARALKDALPPVETLREAMDNPVRMLISTQSEG
ncbi:transglycosylase SLT domain-containing protein [Sagittula sp. MA-2]|jgi:hypothetical protein|uniref:transglycosylase SLT domain-containing protein n=2 Tax=unclassified Sagittula TaxID=2624628 RepID=UPI002795C0FC|nr:transglycosylase SLT domain-containing protein [Sagittula sp. MA-2]